MTARIRKDFAEMFREVEAEQVAAYQARVASGEDAAEREAFRQRSEAERERMERNGCFEQPCEACEACGETGCDCDEDENEDEDD